MQILGLLDMYFVAVVVEVEKYLLFFRLALAIMCVFGGWGGEHRMIFSGV